MSFSRLVPVREIVLPAKKKRGNSSTGGKKKSKIKGLGCEHCPANNKYTKVKGLSRIKGRSIMLWAQNPGQNEAESGLELVGRAGQFLWSSLARVGIRRGDCDIQNVCRCRTVSDEPDKRGRDRTPDKDELKCCSVYNHEALAKNNGHAKVHVVFGKIAGQSLLGREYKKDKPVFFSKVLNADVVCTDHPAYFVRGAPKERRDEFMKRLAFAAKIAFKGKKKDYIAQQDYKGITTVAGAKKELEYQRSRAYKGHRVTVDVEDGYLGSDGKPLDKYKGGKKTMIMVGFCGEQGRARSIWLKHPEVTVKRPKEMLGLIKDFLEDPDVEKVMHHGSYDYNDFKSLAGIKTRGYDFDTNYSAYFVWPGLKSFALGSLADQKFIEFANYKEESSRWETNFMDCPAKIILRRNCADVDLTKRVELATHKKISLPLLKVYTKAAFVLERMEKRGPYLDLKYNKKLRKWLPKRISHLKSKLCKWAKDPDFNPNSSPQVKHVLYDVLKKKPVTIKKQVVYGTGQEVLERIGGPFCQSLQEYRKLTRMDSTYVERYARIAALYDGQLRTAWWLTGAITGRLRSGSAGKDKMSFQNLHGNPVLQNQLVSDPRWEWALQPGSKWKRLQAFLAFDYSQVEIRVLAEMSGCKKLIEAFQKGLDIHCIVGAALTGWSPERIKDEKAVRKLVKNMHFGLVYGLGKGNLYEYVVAKGARDATRKQVEKFYDAYFEEYWEVRDFIDEQRLKAERDGYVETLFGFRRDLGAWDDERGTYWGNQAVNSPIQGTAHQLLLMGLALLWLKKKRYNLLQTPVMEIHDALDFYNDVEDVPDAYKQGKHLMEHGVVELVKEWFGYTFKVPLVAEADFGFRLGTMLKDYRGEPMDQALIERWRELHDERQKEFEKFAA